MNKENKQKNINVRITEEMNIALVKYCKDYCINKNLPDGSFNISDAIRDMLHKKLKGK
jgi:hypothetical protein